MAKRDSLGGVSENEIADFVKETVGPPVEAGASPLTRFVCRLAILVSKRAEIGEENDIAVFLKSDAVAHDVAKHDNKEVPLLANGNDPISGHVWLSPAGLGTAFALKLDWNDVESVFQAIRQAGLGDLPAFVVDWRGQRPEARLYPTGINLQNIENYTPVNLRDEPITADEMKATLDSFHSKCLRTPALSVEGHARSIWKNARLGTPENKPEERVHGRLMDFLRSRFSRHRVRAELVTNEGRVDIVVWSETADEAGHPAMRTDWALELKALVDRTSKGKSVKLYVTRKKLTEGLIQIIAYSRDVQALQAALCCYDMRKNNVGNEECFKPIAKKANDKKIELWRWYLYRSSAKARQAESAATSG